MSKIPALKDLDHQQPIPTEWRNTFTEIVYAFKEGDFKLSRSINRVRPIPTEDADAIDKYIQDYGGQLSRLPEETWRTSVCQWMGAHWEVLVDLYTEEEGASDLVLHARVYEESSDYFVEVHLVYVP